MPACVIYKDPLVVAVDSPFPIIQGSNEQQLKSGVRDGVLVGLGAGVVPNVIGPKDQLFLHFIEWFAISVVVIFLNRVSRKFFLFHN